MKPLSLSLILTATVILFFSSCESVGKSDEMAEKFYQNLKTKNYEAIPAMIDETALETHPADVWIDLLESKDQYWGKFIDYKRTAFSTKTEDNQTITGLDFTVEHENGTVYERLKFVERNGQMKIYSYQYNAVADELN